MLGDLRKLLVSVTGVTLAGKTTLVKLLLQYLAEHYPPVSSGLIISHTTRARRGPPDEDLSGEYAYVMKEDFASMREGGQLAWHTATPKGDQYGTAHASLDEFETLESGIRLMILDLHGVRMLRQGLEERGQLSYHFPVFVTVSEEEFNRRVEKRCGDDSAKTNEFRSRRLRELSWEQEARTSGIPFVWIENAGDPLLVMRKVLNKILENMCLSQ